MAASLAQPPPNKACTGRWGLCRHFKQFPTPYHFPIGRLRAVRPSASNANRWAVVGAMYLENRKGYLA
jgi:hypothetical protein